MKSTHFRKDRSIFSTAALLVMGWSAEHWFPFIFSFKEMIVVQEVIRSIK